MFHLKPKPRPHVHRCAHLGEARGLLGDHHDTRLAPVEMPVDVAQQVNRLEILAAAVLVGHPPARRPGVVEIEHGRHGVHPQGIDVELAHPEQCIRDEEALDLVAPEVEHIGAPVELLALTGIGMFEQRRAIEAAQGPVVLGEMSRDPVEDDADPGCVEGLDEYAQVVRAAMTRVHRVVAGDLIAPARLERVGHDGHELHMGVTHPGEVGGQLLGELTVVEALAPAAHVELVDAHLRVVRVGLRPMRQPGFLARRPCVLPLEDDRRVGRRHLGAEGEGIGLLLPAAVAVLDLVLVAGAGTHALLPQPPDARARHELHVVALPPVEVADHLHPLGVGCPDGEPGAAEVTARVVMHGDDVGTQSPPGLGVTTTVEALQVRAGEVPELVMHDVSFPWGLGIGARAMT